MTATLAVVNPLPYYLPAVESFADTPIAQWLRERFTERGWTGVRQAAKYIGVNHETLRTWVRGEKVPGLRSIETLARFFKVPRADLEALLPAVLDNPDFVPLYVVDDVALSAGAANGILSGTLIGHYHVDHPAERGHRFYLLQVRGNCMAPRIEPGDKVVVNATRRNDWRPGELVALSHDGGLLVKQARGTVEFPLFVADDGTEIEPDGETRVLGVVVEIRKKP